jgi:hypothetical protein
VILYLPEIQAAALVQLVIKLGYKRIGLIASASRADQDILADFSVSAIFMMHMRDIFHVEVKQSAGIFFC